MATLQDITYKVNIAKLLLIDSVREVKESLIQGYGSLHNATALKRLIRALSFDINAGVNDATTLCLYKCLLKAMGDYGATYAIDPTVSVPGQTIIVEGGGIPVDYTYGENKLIEDGAGSGNWYLPFLKPDATQFLPGTKPLQLTIDGVGQALLPNYNYLPMRLYGFANNAAQTIILTVI